MLGAAMNAVATGYVLSALSCAANGSFAALLKLPTVAAAEAPPVAFQLYASAGVALSSLAAAPPLTALANRWATLDDGAPQTTSIMLTGYGALAGMLFVVAIALSFAAIPLIGLATAQSVWGGIAILVSFAWGVAALGNRVESAALAALGLVLLVSSVGGIASCEEMGEFVARRLGYAAGGSARRYEPVGERSSELPGSTTGGAGRERARVLGLVYSVLVGVADGSILVPSHFETHAIGFAFLPSFGLGALGASLVVTGAFALKEGGVPDMKARQTAWAGVLSGVLWNVGNALSIAAIPRLGYAVAYPLLQCSLLVGGLWGVFCFKEIGGKPAVAAFFGSACVLIAGAGMLGMSTTA